MNLAVFALATSLIPSSNGFSEEANENFIAKAPIVMTTESGIRYPLDNIKITQGYKFYHPAIDFDGITGNPIYPILSGKVAGIQYSRYAYGNAVLIDHGNDITSLYAHLSQIFVNKGQGVDIHTIIGTVGATGRAYGDHLHLEVRDHNYPINPLTLLP
jgi:murein DD-endopeptidase MepM/ murein hydrolase activator NlpD